jgi:hypothetical protein
MADITTTGRSFLHFSGVSGDVITFNRTIASVILTAPTGSALTVVFNAEVGAVPLPLAVGTHEFFVNPYSITVGGTGTLTGVGVAT